ncbi:polynucleotide adenylyltransferase [Caenorhabditis elegans]|uniref:polynucleotide adenylyltransferase n=3 Tax=Caenorhabditis elegans TaxID=6239 RepID=H2KZ00_CAEEL|nr:polynucleotide adenylyltransferase [Caenorhabditis elegans]CCD65444.1 polynucleotide adenylyltransferase [Caenorhabditis elegans]|eukprot:NP_491581.1 Prion-like-(Q/N-rich)-domain-bearing protein [Caenorhabditis elegans]
MRGRRSRTVITYDQHGNMHKVLAPHGTNRMRNGNGQNQQGNQQYQQCQNNYQNQQNHQNSNQGYQEPQNEQFVSRTMILAKGQMKRLRAVLEERVEIHGRGNFPTISTKLINLIRCLRQHMGSVQVEARDVRLNGGAASFVASSDDFSYADLDLIFPIQIDEESDENVEKQIFDAIRDSVFMTIRELMPDNIGKEKFDFETLKDVYIRKMIKVSTDNDKWSLFSLNNEYGRCIELKFVNKMRRQFEFSVDSFQIHLDPLLNELDECEQKKITIESMYGDVQQAMTHLHERLIDTVKPEEIRGGGLLKYCHLIIRGYKAAKPWNCRKLERYMCSRFFIDFPDLISQENKLRNYLDSHFGTSFNGATYDQWSSSGSDTDSEASTSQATTSSLLVTGQAKYDFLMLLYRVIDESTVCLMAHERNMSLNMIDRVAFQLSMQCYTPPNFSSGSSTPPRTTLFYLPPDAATWIPVI